MSAHLIISMIFLTSLLFVSNNALADYAKWSWSQHLPIRLSTYSVKANRFPDAVRNFFHGLRKPPSLQQTLDFFGLPEEFSPQFIYSKEKGSSEHSETASTLRFLLNDGSEVHIWTGDFESVSLAILHRKKGHSELLYK